MKKVLLILSFFVAVVSYAQENLVSVIPMQIDTNVDIDSENCGSIEIQLVGTKTAVSLNFDLCVPNALSFNPEYYYEGEEVLPYTSKKGVKTFKHTIDVQAYPEAKQTMAGYTIYLINVFAMDGSAFTANEGVLMSFDLGSGSTEGVFPIYVSNQAINASSTDTFGEESVTTSYVVVGNPTNATLALEGVVPSFVTSALNTETAVKNLDLSKATKVNGTMDLSNKGITAINSDNVTCEKVTYKRESTGWGTYCFPFATQVEGAYFADAIDNSYVKLTATGSANNGEAFLKKGGVDITSENVTLKAGIAETHLTRGVYTLTNITEEDTYYLKDNKFLAINDNFNVAPFKAYLKAEVAGARSLVIDEETTAIEALNAFMDNEYEAIYDVNGICLDNLQKGVNIVKLADGKVEKIIVK